MTLNVSNLSPPPPIFNLLQLQLSAKEDIVTVNEGNTKTIIQKDSENAKTRKRGSSNKIIVYKTMSL